MTADRPIVRRLDHIIFAARDRHAWAADIERVLALQRGRGRDTDDWGFSNWEFDIGDGFLGLVSPAADGRLLDSFLAKRGDSFYAISISVGSIQAAAAHFDREGVAYRAAVRDGVPVLLWPAPAGTAGVLFQVIDGLPATQGANPNLRGLGRAVIASADRAAGVAALQRAFGFGGAREAHDVRLGADVSVLSVPGSPLGNELVVAQASGDGPVARHVARYGTSVYEWTLATDDVDAEVRRLARQGIDCVRDAADPGLAWLPDGALGAMRLGFHQRR